MDPEIRRITRDEQESEAYRDLYEQDIERQEAEYEAEFGPEYRAVHPFRPDGLAAHRAATEAIEQQRRSHD